MNKTNKPLLKMLKHWRPSSAESWLKRPNTQRRKQEILVLCDAENGREFEALIGAEGQRKINEENRGKDEERKRRMD